MQNDTRPTAGQRYEVGYGPAWPTWYVWDNHADPPAMAALDPETVIARLNAHDAQATRLAHLERERNWLREWVLMRSFGGRWPHIDSPTHLAGLLAALHADTPPAQPAPPPEAPAQSAEPCILNLDGEPCCKLCGGLYGRCECNGTGVGGGGC